MARQRGFSLIELMVGMVVSMICMLAIMAAFATYEGKKRTTTSGNDAQQNGSYALYALERNLRTAGSGIVQGYRYSLWGCPVTAYTNGTQTLPATSLPSPFGSSNWPLTTRLVPVLIAADSDTTKPDVIGVVGGNAAQQVFKIDVTSASAVDSVTVKNALGILSGDYLIGILSNGTCAMAHIAASSTGTATQVANTSIPLETSNSPTTGLQNATYLFDAGPSPIVTLFGIDSSSNSLVSWDLLQRKVYSQAAAVTPLADGIVMMKALYGIQTSESSALTWVKPTGTWAIGTLTTGTSAASISIDQIKAIRVALIAQSRLPERATDYTNTTPIILFNDLDPTVQYTFTPKTQFRYQVYETTIPVRNALVTMHY